MQRVGIIGFGNMGSSIARGLAAKDPDLRFDVVDPSRTARERAVREFTATDCTETPERLFERCELIVLATKPQDLEATAGQLRAHSAGAAIISVLAGTPLRRISERFATARVVRFMPSLAAGVGKALVGVAFGEEADETLRERALAVAGAIGTPLVVDERLLAAITGVSGSGLAYAFSFAHALALGGVSTGLTYDEALRAAITVLDGAAEVLRATGEHPEALASRVSSPAGTTIRGLAALERGAFTATVIEAVEQAAARAVELEG